MVRAGGSTSGGGRAPVHVEQTRDILGHCQGGMGRVPDLRPSQALAILLVHRVLATGDLATPATCPRRGPNLVTT